MDWGSHLGLLTDEDSSNNSCIPPSSWRHPTCSWSSCQRCMKVTCSQCWMALALPAALVPAANRKVSAGGTNPPSSTTYPASTPRCCSPAQLSNRALGITDLDRPQPAIRWTEPTWSTSGSKWSLCASAGCSKAQKQAVVQRSKACLGLLWVGREPKGAAGKQQVAPSQKLTALPGIPACILEVKLHFNPSGSPSSELLCEYLFDKQAVKHFSLDLTGEEFTFLLTASPSLGVL